MCIYRHIYTYMLNWYKSANTHRERIISSTKGVGKPRYSHAKEYNWTVSLYHTQQNQIKMK